MTLSCWQAAKLIFKETQETKIGLKVSEVSVIDPLVT